MRFKNKAQFKLNYVLAMFLTFILLFAFYHLFMKKMDSIEIKISSETIKVDKESFLLTYLRTPLSDGTISDYLIYYYLSDEKELLEKETDKIIKEVYGEDTKWKIQIGEKSFKNYESVFTNPNPLEINLPLFADSENVEILLKLSIYG